MAFGSHDEQINVFFGYFLVKNEKIQRQSTISSACVNIYHMIQGLDAVGSSGILKVKENLDITFNFDKQDVIDFTKFSKMTMCRASEANS